MKSSTFRHTQPSVALMGYRGCGKTSVGCRLASLTGMPHVDTDEIIIRAAGRSITEIFAREGESGFRARERKAVNEAIAQSPVIISLGGGAVMDQQNVSALSEAATLVWLIASPEAVLQRTSDDPTNACNRPALTDLEEIEEVKLLLSQRTPTYARVADIKVDTTGQTIDEVTRTLIKLLDIE